MTNQSTPAMANTPGTRIRAGAAMVDITPALGTHLGGTWGILRGVQTVLERIYARALVLEQDGEKICLIAPDLEMVTRPWTERVRDAVQAKCGIAGDAVMLAFQQIHSVPAIGNFLLDDALPNVPEDHEYLRGSQRDYCEIAVAGMIEAVVKANNCLRPVRFASGRAVRDDLAFNRRGVLRNGKIVMPWLYSDNQKPLGPTDICYMEGPMDPEVGLLALKDDQDWFVAAVLHHTCHPVNVFATSKFALSSDWPGVWAAGVQQALGDDCVALVLNGCCGNINPIPPFTPDFQPDHRRMGQELTRSVAAILPTLQFNSTAELSHAVSRVLLPLKQAAPQDRAWAEQMLREHPAPLWLKNNPKQLDKDWMDAAMLMSVELERERTPEYDYEIQAFRLGNTTLLGLPGEPFVEGQLAIKQSSPSEYTFVGHCSNDYAGYIAPVASYPRGGHEIRDRPAKWTRLVPGSLEVITEHTAKLLQSMFP